MFPTYCADIMMIVNAKKNDKIKRIFILNVLYHGGSLILLKSKAIAIKEKIKGLQRIAFTVVEIFLDTVEV